MKIDDLIRGKDILESSKKVIYCNTKTAELLKREHKEIFARYAVNVNDFVEDNQVIVYHISEVML